MTTGSGFSRMNTFEWVRGLGVRGSNQEVVSVGTIPSLLLS